MALLHTHTHTHTLQACGKEPLLNVTGELAAILAGTCELLEMQKLTAKLYNESDLHAILEENILDICQWVCA